MRPVHTSRGFRRGGTIVPAISRAWIECAGDPPAVKETSDLDRSHRAHASLRRVRASAIPASAKAAQIGVYGSGTRDQERCPPPLRQRLATATSRRDRNCLLER